MTNVGDEIKRITAQLIAALEQLDNVKDRQNLLLIVGYFISSLGSSVFVRGKE